MQYCGKQLLFYSIRCRHARSYTTQLSCRCRQSHDRMWIAHLTRLTVNLMNKRLILIFWTNNTNLTLLHVCFVDKLSTLFQQIVTLTVTASVIELYHRFKFYFKFVHFFGALLSWQRINKATAPILRPSRQRKLCIHRFKPQITVKLITRTKKLVSITWNRI